MKTAEEWEQEKDLETIYNIPRQEIIPIIKQIQLDAWKQGMTYAANLTTDDLGWDKGYILEQMLEMEKDGSWEH